MTNQEIIDAAIEDIIAHSASGFNRAPAQLEQFRHILEDRILYDISTIYYHLLTLPDLPAAHPRTSDEYPSEAWELAIQVWDDPFPFEHLMKGVA